MAVCPSDAHNMSIVLLGSVPHPRAIAICSFLIPFEYLRYLFETLPNLGNGNLDELLPWSPSLPETCRARKDG